MANPITTYSGDWKVKMQLARAQLVMADILMIDDPTTGHMDVTNVEWVKTLIRNFDGFHHCHISQHCLSSMRCAPKLSSSTIKNFASSKQRRERSGHIMWRHTQYMEVMKNVVLFTDMNENLNAQICTLVSA